MSFREPRIYLLPTMMTAGNILAGFVAILQIFQAKVGEAPIHYKWAIVAILAKHGAPVFGLRYLISVLLRC